MTATMGRYMAAAMQQGATAFNPENDITWHSLFWAEGSSMSGYSDTDSVTTWYNETGETDATATDGVTYAAAYTNLNSQPAVVFDGANCDLSTSAFSTNPSYTSGVSIVAVVYGSPDANSFICDGIGVSNRNVVYSDTNNTAVIFAGSSVDSGTTWTNAAHAVVGFFDGSTGAEVLTLDGNEEANSNAGSQTLTGISIGHWYSNSGNDWNGAMALLGIYEGDVTADGSWSSFTSWASDHYGVTF